MERNTRQRSAIKDAVADAARPLLPAEILEAAQSAVPKLNLATVYRTLRKLLDDGELATVALPGEPARYESALLQHHHHFKCRQCERVFEVDGCSADLASLAPPGFSVDGHELTLYGLCSACAAADPTEAPGAAAGSA